jgi:AraC-like DNA-binding protein
MNGDMVLESHSNFEIVLIENCVGERMVGWHSEAFHGTQLLLFGGHLPHCLRYFEPVNPEIPAYVIQVHFLPDFLGRDFLKTHEAKLLTELFTNSARGICFRGETIRLARSIIQEMLFERGLAKLALMLRLLETLAFSKFCELLNPLGFTITRRPREVNRMKDILEYMYENFRHPISVKDVADILPMSVSAFCRFFKSKTGKTFVGLIKEIRIDYAKRLLLEGNFRVSEVCYMCGYNNISNFNKHFREIQGTSPSKFLERYFVQEYEPEYYCTNRSLIK